MTQNNALLTKLVTAGLVQNTSSEADAEQSQDQYLQEQHSQEQHSQELSSPWYIKTLLAFSGWLGAVFFLAFIALFLFMNNNLDEPIFVGAVGILLVVCAYFILRVPKNEFFEHTGLAISLAGQALVVYSFVGGSLFGDHSDYISWFFIGIFHTVLAILMPNFVHRVFSSAFAAISFDASFLLIGASHIVSSIALILLVVLYNNEFKTTKSYQKISGAVYGLMIYWLIVNCIISVDAVFLDLFYRYDKEALFQLPYQVIPALFVFAILFSIWEVINPTKKINGYNKKVTVRQAAFVLAFSLVICLLTLTAGGVPAALVIILLGFSRSNKVMMAMGIIALLSYCSVYYYMMEQTLLYKSAILFTVGIFMLMTRFFLVRFWPETKEPILDKADADGVEHA